MKLTIFHFGDSHWICNYKDPSDPARSRPTKEEIDFYEEYIEDFAELTLEQHFGGQIGDEGVFVHTGDFANFYIEDFRKHPIEMQFTDIKNRHLEQLKKAFPRIKRFIAVPGNHDTNRCDGGEELEVKFRDFITALNGWETSFSKPPVVRIPIPGMVDKSVSLFLFNSSATVWNPRGGDAPVPYASVQRKYRLKPTESDFFKIAILHHNVLPQYGQRNKEVSDDVFVDNGDFNSYLSKYNFKLVLSGHQHLDNDVSFSIGDPMSSFHQTRPLVENSVLSLSTPSFLRPELATQLGFNVIEIDVSPSSNIADLTITRYRYLREQAKFEAKPATKHLLLLPKIEDVGGLHEQARRLKISTSFLNKIYDPGYKVEQLERVLSRPSQKEHFERMRKSIEMGQKLATNNIFAMYSTAILPAHTWMRHEQTFHRLFLTNATRGFKRSPQAICAEETLFNFRFSKPVYAAILQSLANAKSLNVSERIWQRQLPVNDEVVAFISSTHTQPKCSLSQWEGNPVIPVGTGATIGSEQIGLFRNQKISLQFNCNNRDIPDTFSISEAEVYPEEPFEIARILLWPMEYFRSEDALQFIELHEESFIPLFWIDPTRLKSRVNTFRNEIGYALLYAYKFKDFRTKEKPILQSEPQVFLNNASGEALIPAELIHLSRMGSLSSLDSALWGQGGAPEYYRLRNRHLSAEFSSLLYRPDILLAVDAFAMIQTHHYDDVRNELASIYGWCDEWLTGQSTGNSPPVDGYLI